MEELREAIQESWTKAVLAAESVEEHAEAVVSSLGAKASMAPEQARKLASDVAERLQSHRKSLTGEVERAVQSALGLVRMPARHDLKLLSDKVSAIEEKLVELERSFGIKTGIFKK